MKDVFCFLFDGLPADIFDEGFEPAPPISQQTSSMKTLAGDTSGVSSNSSFKVAPSADVFNFGELQTTELTMKRDVGVPSRFDTILRQMMFFFLGSNAHA